MSKNSTFWLKPKFVSDVYQTYCEKAFNKQLKIKFLIHDSPLGALYHRTYSYSHLWLQLIHTLSFVKQFKLSYITFSSLKIQQKTISNEKKVMRIVSNQLLYLELLQLFNDNKYAVVISFLFLPVVIQIYFINIFSVASWF